MAIKSGTIIIKVIGIEGLKSQYNIPNEKINSQNSFFSKKILGNIKYIYFERCNLGPIRNDASCVWDLASHDISTSIYLLNKLPNINLPQAHPI